MKKTLSANVIGALWIVLNVLCFLTSNLIIKEIGATHSSFQILFVRCMFMALMLSPFIVRRGLKVMASKQIKFYFLRLAYGVLNTMMSYYAITKIPFATSTAITFTRPLFTLVLAYFMLGEVLGMKKVLAGIFGFLGVIVILRPGNFSFELGEFAALGAAVFVALAYIYVQKLSKTENHLAMMMWFALVTGAAAFGPAMMVWKPLSLTSWGLLFAASVFASLGQYCVIKGYRIGEVSVITPFEYLHIPLSSLAGFLLFSEKIYWTTAVGSLMIVLSGFFILRIKAPLQKPPPEPPK